MTQEFNADAIANALREVAYDEPPVNVSHTSSKYAEILKQLPMKWVDTPTMQTILNKLGIVDKHLANNMHKLGKVQGIEKRKVGRYNFFRFNPNATQN